MVMASLGGIVESLLGVRIQPTMTALGGLLIQTRDPRALGLRRLHVQVLSVSNTVSRLLIGLVSDWLSYAAEPLPPHSPVTEEDDGRPKTFKQKMQETFHRKPQVSRLAIMALASVLLAAVFAFGALGLDRTDQLWFLSTGKRA